MRSAHYLYIIPQQRGINKKQSILHKLTTHTYTVHSGPEYPSFVRLPKDKPIRLLTNCALRKKFYGKYGILKSLRYLNTATTNGNSNGRKPKRFNNSAVYTKIGTGVRLRTNGATMTTSAASSAIAPMSSTGFLFPFAHINHKSVVDKKLAIAKKKQKRAISSPSL